MPPASIVYLNATLAGWLGYDLAEFSPSGLKISDLVQGSSAALLTGIAPVHGEVVTQVLDLDLRRKNGQSLPVRLHHKVAFAPDGTAGPSRTLVLNRAPTDAPGDAARAAEVRFARFFHNTPMAIATIDQHGRIGQSNATFARLVGGAETRSVFAVADERERARFESFVRGVLEGQAGTKTLEVALTGGQRFAQFYVTPVEGGNERRSRDRARDRHHRAARAADPVRAGAEDARGRPARRRRRARLQQRADRDDRLHRSAARQSPADRSLVPGHHADQAERQPRGGPGAAIARVLAPADAAARGCCSSARCSRTCRPGS